MSDLSYQLFIKGLAERWQLTDKQYSCLLALGVAAGDDLLAIDTTLKQLFARSPALAELWMTSPNKAFDERTPMDLIETEGMAGLERVVGFLCLKR